MNQSVQNVLSNMPVKLVANKQRDKQTTKQTNKEISLVHGSHGAIYGRMGPRPLRKSCESSPAAALRGQPRLSAVEVSLRGIWRLMMLNVLIDVWCLRLTEELLRQPIVVPAGTESDAAATQSLHRLIGALSQHSEASTRLT